MNYKIRVNNEAESKEVQELFQQLGYNRRPYLLTNERMHNDGYPDDYEIGFLFAEVSGYISCANKTSTTFFTDHRFKEIAIPQLKDLVVLKRNSIDDATHIRGDGKKYFHAESTDYFYQFSDDNEWLLSTWMNCQLLPQLKPIEKKEMKEYLVPQEDGTYKLQLAYPLTAWQSWIPVPEGATIYAVNGDVTTFYKDDGNTQFDDVEWKPCDGVGLVVYNNLKTFLRFGDGGKVVWERQKDVEELMTEGNQVVVDTQTIVDVNPIFGHSDLFDKIRKGEISFDFSEMKTGRDEDVVENPQPSKPSDLFKEDYTNLNKIKVEWFEKFLHGVKVQCRVIGTKGWQNMTWKSLDKMKLNLEFREKPKTIEVDGMKFDTVDKLTSYLKSMTNLK